MLWPDGVVGESARVAETNLLAAKEIAESGGNEDSAQDPAEEVLQDSHGIYSSTSSCCCTLAST